MTKSFPPDVQKELERRNKLLRLLAGNPEKQAFFKAHYRNNPIDWINDWCITYDPRLPGLKTIPFILFPRQEEFVYFILDCLQYKVSGLAEKCRDVGLSWLCCAIAAWLWLFHPGSAIGFGSRKEEYVDEKENPKAIFPKIRKILEYLPAFMLPEGFNMRKHTPYMKIINPENDSTITGEAGDNIGRGGRTTVYFKDEAAHYERPELIEAALGDNTDVQIDISSVNGSANVFYRRRMAGTIWHKGMHIEKDMVLVFIMDWRDHPAKDQNWYDTRYKIAEREGLLHVFKQEVDRDYAGSVERIIIPQDWVRAAIDAHLKLKIPIEGAKIAGQDIADGGRDKNALVMRHGILLKYAEDWGGGDAGDAAKRAIPECLTHGIHEIYYDSIGVGSAFKTAVNNLKEAGNFPDHLQVYPWDAGQPALNPEENIIFGDSQSPLNKDFYYNIKAQAWWSLRTRFYKTFKAINYGEKYDHSELISLDSKLPNLQKVMLELSQAQYRYSLDSRLVVEKKPEGSTSPNLADSIVMAYHPCKVVSILDSPLWK